jgi:hypothetical protein
MRISKRLAPLARRMAFAAAIAFAVAARFAGAHAAQPEQYFPLQSYRVGSSSPKSSRR